MRVGGEGIHEEIGRDISNLTWVSNNNVCATEENERFQREVEILTGNVKVPGANDFRTKDIFETSCVGGGDSGIVDYGSCVDNILHSTELGVDIARKAILFISSLYLFRLV